jgi:hypothetical protein
VKALGSLFGFSPKHEVKANLNATVLSAVEERTGVNADTEHFLQAQGLGTELDFVATAMLGPAALILDGERTPEALGAGEGNGGLRRRGGQAPFRRRKGASPRKAVELDDIRFARETEAQRVQRETARDAQVAPRLIALGMDAVMKQLALNGELALLPNLLEMVERRPSLAVDDVLQRGQWKEVIFLESPPTHR